jgi:signal peptidase I
MARAVSRTALRWSAGTGGDWQAVGGKSRIHWKALPVRWGLHAPGSVPTLPGMFAPKWKKEAKLLYKGAKKYIHYKRDLLKQDRIDEIESRRADLLEAIKANDKEKTEEASKQLRNTCEKALPHFPQQSAWEENVEVIFVALVVALGLRAYVVQPFRIPTNSMQPTLNGINIRSQDSEYKKPWFGKQAWDFVLRGRSYQDIVAENDCHVVDMKDRSWFLFTRTEVTFSDGRKVKFAAPDGEVKRHLKDPLSPPESPRLRSFKKGDPILRGWVDAGDLVLVDKVSYHFRKPKRGEVFVFDTRGIATGGRNTGQMSDQSEGTHYIKRLCGVPGDTLSIQPPNLWVNGKIAQEPGIQKVIRAEGEYGKLNPGGYQVSGRDSRYPCPLSVPGKEFSLADKAPPGMREYAALGDNTNNSLDSRYWGSAKEFNLAGPALFSLWPITSGHWGFIR